MRHVLRLSESMGTCRDQCLRQRWPRIPCVFHTLLPQKIIVKSWGASNNRDCFDFQWNLGSRKWWFHKWCVASKPSVRFSSTTHRVSSSVNPSLSGPCMQPLRAASVSVSCACKEQYDPECRSLNNSRDTCTCVCARRSWGDQGQINRHNSIRKHKRFSTSQLFVANAGTWLQGGGSRVEITVGWPLRGGDFCLEILTFYECRTWIWSLAHPGLRSIQDPDFETH